MFHKTDNEIIESRESAIMIFVSRVSDQGLRNSVLITMRGQSLMSAFRIAMLDGKGRDCHPIYTGLDFRNHDMISVYS